LEKDMIPSREQVTQARENRALDRILDDLERLPEPTAANPDDRVEHAERWDGQS